MTNHSEAVDLLARAWEAAVMYRHHVHATTDIYRPHVEDIETWGVLKELQEDGHLVGHPREVMARIIEEQKAIEIFPGVGLAQGMYDAIIDLVRTLGALDSKYDDQ